jgi:CheY-like chemotaxis protein
MDEDILKGKTLLVVDDESDLRDIVASELEFLGAEVHQAENIVAAQKLINQHHIDLIISDIRMPGGTGIDLLNIVKAKNESAPMILITGFADITTEDAFDKGAEALVNKPFKLDDLIKLVVRYTSPISERFKEIVPAEKVIHPSPDDVHFGRGGLAIAVDTKGKRIDVGEAVKFDFNYNDHKFAGEGICRWLRVPEQGTGKAIMGLEFMKLDDQSLKNFDMMVAGKKVVPYIPSSKY